MGRCGVGRCVTVVALVNGWGSIGGGDGGINSELGLLFLLILII